MQGEALRLVCRFGPGRFITIPDQQPNTSNRSLPSLLAPPPVAPHGPLITLKKKRDEMDLSDLEIVPFQNLPTFYDK